MSNFVVIFSNTELIYIFNTTSYEHRVTWNTFTNTEVDFGEYRKYIIQAILHNYYMFSIDIENLTKENITELFNTDFEQITSEIKNFGKNLLANNIKDRLCQI